MKVREFLKTPLITECEDYSYVINTEDVEYDPVEVEDEFMDLDVIGSEHKSNGYVVINVLIPNYTSLADFLYG